jgi:DNA (cytosine-5)-methyltransferase 1
LIFENGVGNMIFRKGELFSGPGGLSLGAQLAEVISPTGVLYKVQHTWANDYDIAACETFRHNICPNSPETVLEGDVRTLKIESLPAIDAFSFGFPCNDYSNVGEKKGFNGDFGPLYLYGVKVLNVHKPLWFIAENVGGLESANEGEAFIRILSDLEKAGYSLTPHLYKFHEYGVPQARQRIIIVGIRKDLGLQFKVPEPTHGANNYITSRQALEEPPIPTNASNQEYTNHQGKVIEMLSHIPPGENAWYEGLPKHLRLNVKKTKISQIYKRLHPDKPAYTVTGSGGGGTHMYHYATPRALTNRERARLQTFPDNYEFLGGKEAVRKQIGMAVPPLAAKVIVEAILKTFAGVPYNTVEAKWTFDSSDDEVNFVKNKAKEESGEYVVG